MPLKQGSNAPVTKLPFQTQDKPALVTARLGLSVPWSLRPRNRAAAATCGHGCCELPAILRATQKSLAASDFFCGRRNEKPCDFCSGMVASPLAATVVIAILRCDFCAAKG